MRQVSLRYGHEQLNIELKTSHQLGVLKSRSRVIDPIGLALAAPIGTPPLHKIVRAGQRITIITSDITRPCPSDLMLPPIMNELAKAGIRDEDVTVVFALGVHRANTPEECMRLIGSEMYTRLRCINSDPKQVVYVGTTKRGTPIEVFEPVVHSDLRIALGNVELHYFAGYTGGAKAVVPGVCSLKTIQHNHAMMVDPRATLGILDGNPVREDLEEGAAFVGLDFILNVVLDDAHTIVAAAAGHPVQAHRWACQVVDYLSKVQIEQLADIILVSAGGYPKDINLYQAQKALENAAAAVRPGGLIIWVAECAEGLGNTIFEEWLVGSSTDQILRRLQKQFVLGGHKAAAIAGVLKHATVWLVSKLPPEQVRACGLTPYADAETALADALKQMGADAVIGVIPEGSAVMPFVV